MPATLEKWDLVGLWKLLKVHLSQNLVIKLEILFPFIHYVHKGLLIHKIWRSKVLGEGIEPWRAFGNDSSVAIAVISHLVFDFAVNNFESGLAVLFLMIVSSVDVDSSSFEDIYPLVSYRLIDEIVGREEAMNEFAGDGALECVGPLSKEEEWGLDYSQIVRSDYIFISFWVPFLSG